VLSITVALGATADWLVDHGQLAAWDADNRDAVRAPLEQAVRLWSTYETT
jgi:hypothetical protein